MRTVQVKAILFIDMITIRANQAEGNDVTVDGLVSLDKGMSGKRVQAQFHADEKLKRSIVDLLAAQGFEAKVE